MVAPTAQLRYYHGAERLRYVGSWAATALTTATLGIPGTVIRLIAGYGAVAHSCARLWARALLRIHGISLETSGGEDLDRSRSYLFVANQQSALDTPALLVALPVCHRILGPTSQFRSPFGGWYRGLEGYASKGGRGDVPTGRRLDLSGSPSTVVFVSEVGGIDDLQRVGDSWVTLASAAPGTVVPLAVINSVNLMPAAARVADPGSIQVRIGSPVEVAADSSAHAVAAAVGQAIADLTTAEPA